MGMALLYAYLVIGACYALFSIRTFLNDPTNPDEARKAEELMEQHKHLSILVFVAFTLGWLPIILWLLIQISQDETT